MRPSTDIAHLSRFREAVLGHYALRGRDLPWRRTRDPYRIMVSEFMLQQTQVERVLPRYQGFLVRFPEMRGLAEAPTADVLREWQGLGYNRRALNLQRAARVILLDHGGRFPRSTPILRSLPGVGPATAAALAAFVHGEPVLLIETNVRAAILHHFFPEQLSVSDAQILPVVEATLDRHDPRTWYYALMDYGSWLKKACGNPARRSKHHARQAPFAGSRRELRGQILRLFLAARERPHVQKEGEAKGVTAEEIIESVAERRAGEAQSVLRDLVKEGFLQEEDGRRYILA